MNYSLINLIWRTDLIWWTDWIWCGDFIWWSDLLGLGYWPFKRPVLGLLINLLACSKTLTFSCCWGSQFIELVHVYERGTKVSRFTSRGNRLSNAHIDILPLFRYQSVLFDLVVISGTMCVILSLNHNPKRTKCIYLHCRCQQ